MTIRERFVRQMEGFRAHRRGEPYDQNQDRDWRYGWTLYTLHLANLSKS